jgi:DNA gyrase/topoisomerase IV subunit A
LADADSLLRALLDLTQLRTTVNVNMVALVEGEESTVTLRALIGAYIDRRRGELGPGANDRIRSDLRKLAVTSDSARRTTIGDKAT